MITLSALTLTTTIGLVSSSTDSVFIYPKQPMDGVPVVLTSELKNVQGPNGETSRFTWTVNDEIVKTGSTPNTFRVSFENGLQADDDDSLAGSIDADIVHGRFRNAAHLGINSRLSYLAHDNVTTDSGSVSLWFALDKDISDPIYDNYNRLFWFLIDAKNYLYFQLLPPEQFRAGVALSSAVTSDTFEVHARHVPIFANEWHHIVWIWDAKQDTQKIFLDGGEINFPLTDYRSPFGFSEIFYIGSAQYFGAGAVAKIDEFRLFNRALTQKEIEVLFNQPKQDLDAILEHNLFKVGDKISCLFEYFDGQRFRPAITLGPWVVQPNPIVSIDPPSDVLPPGTMNVPLHVTTLQPAECRCDTVDKPFNEMSVMMNGGGGTQHNYSFPVDTDKPYSLYFRCTPAKDLGHPWQMVKRASYRVLRDYNPDYPRIFSAGWFFDPRMHSISELSKFDLVSFYESVNITPKIAAVARSENPYLKILLWQALTYPLGTSKEDEILIAAVNDRNHPLFNCILTDAQGHILQDPFWKHFYYNLDNPAYTDFRVETIAQKWERDCLIFDGIFADNVFESISPFALLGDIDGDGKPDSAGIDIDRDGISDSVEKLDVRWQQGVIRLLQRLREKIPNAVYTSNGGTTSYSTWLNGRMFENYIAEINDLGYSFLTHFLNDYLFWSEKHHGPWALSPVIQMAPSELWNRGLNWSACLNDDWLNEDPTRIALIDSVRQLYRRMRFGLCCALMGDGLYSYDFGLGCYGTNWWYDEYDVPLGKPTSNASQVNGSEIWRRDFANGTALVNPISDTVVVKLEKIYYAIRGIQDPVVNHGDAVERIVIPPFDGRILLSSPTSVNERSISADKFYLNPNYPNPFNPATTITFQIPFATQVKIKIYNLIGQEVRTLLNNKLELGKHSIVWDGMNDQGGVLPSGVYIFRMQADDFVMTRKFLLLK